ncbi:MAG: hypothetical protein ABJ056_03865 [Halioglobus sp.]
MIKAAPPTKSDSVTVSCETYCTSGIVQPELVNVSLGIQPAMTSEPLVVMMSPPHRPGALLPFLESLATVMTPVPQEA